MVVRHSFRSPASLIFVAAAGGSEVHRCPRLPRTLRYPFLLTMDWLAMSATLVGLKVAYYSAAWFFDLQ